MILQLVTCPHQDECLLDRRKNLSKCKLTGQVYCQNVVLEVRMTSDWHNSSPKLLIMTIFPILLGLWNAAVKLSRIYHKVRIDWWPITEYLRNKDSTSLLFTYFHLFNLFLSIFIYKPCYDLFSDWTTIMGKSQFPTIEN